MKTKRVLCLILSFVMILSATSLCAILQVTAAAHTVSLESAVSICYTNEEFDLSVKLDNTSDIYGGEFEITYDSMKFQPLSVVQSLLSADCVSAYNPDTPGKITVSFASTVALTGSDIDMYVITFRALTQAVTNSPFSIDGKLFDSTNSEVTGITKTGTAVTIKERTLTGITVTTPPTKVIYAVSEPLDLTGMVVTATLSSGGTLELDSDFYTVSGFDSSATANPQTVTVTYSFDGETYADAFDVAIVSQDYTINVTGPKLTFPSGSPVLTFTDSGATGSFHTNNSPANVLITLTSAANLPVSGLNISIDGANASSFYAATPLSGTTLAASGDTLTFAVTPLAGDGLKGNVGTHTATIVITDDSGSVNIVIPMSYLVRGTAPAYSMTIDQTAPFTFDNLTEGYTSVTPKAVTITNTSAAFIKNPIVTISGTDATAFEIISAAGFATSAIDPSLTGTFNVQPIAGLSAGTYNATITLSMTKGNDAVGALTETFDVSVTVAAASTAQDISLSQTTPFAFASRGEGYAPVAAKTITINNVGTEAVTGGTISLGGANAASFTLSASTFGSIATGGNTTFTIKPNDALAIGSYTATVIVSGPTNNVAFDVAFEVTTAPPFIYGDVDSTGVVNINDLIRLAQHLAGIVTLDGSELLAADVDPNGNVNINDLIKLAQYLAGISGIILGA